MQGISENLRLEQIPAIYDSVAWGHKNPYSSPRQWAKLCLVGYLSGSSLRLWALAQSQYNGFSSWFRRLRSALFLTPIIIYMPRAPAAPWIYGAVNFSLSGEGLLTFINCSCLPLKCSLYLSPNCCSRHEKPSYLHGDQFRHPERCRLLFPSQYYHFYLLAKLFLRFWLALIISSRFASVNWNAKLTIYSLFEI